MKKKKYVIIFDILGFGEGVKVIEGVDYRIIRDRVLQLIKNEIARFTDECLIIGKDKGADDWILVLENRDYIHYCISRLLNLDTGFDKFRYFQMGIFVGVAYFEQNAIFDGERLRCEDTIIKNLKLAGIIDEKYREEYRKVNKHSPKTTYIIYSQTFFNELDFIDRKFYEKYQFIESKSNIIIKYYVANINRINEKGKIIDFLFKISNPFNKLYERINEVYIQPIEYLKIKRTLEEKRLIFITGTPEFGKTFTAVRLLWEYYNKGYEPKWVVGKEKGERYEVRRKLENIESLVKPRQIIYFEDPFGKVEYEQRENLGREIGTIIDIIEKIDDVYVIITSREELFKNFLKWKTSSKDLEEFECKLNIKSPSYDYKKRKEMLLKWAEVFNCRWLNNERIKSNILNKLNNIRILPTPLNIRHFAQATTNLYDEREIMSKLKEKSEEISIVFAKEIEEMSKDKQLFLTLLMINVYIKNEHLAILYDETLRYFNLNIAAAYDEIINWFKSDKIIIKGDYIQFSHPSYHESLNHLLEIHYFQIFYNKILIQLNDIGATPGAITHALLVELDKLLKIRSPSSKHIEILKILLEHPTTEKYFFKHLESPDWLKKLKKLDIFLEPPKKIVEKNDVHFPGWMISKYLIKIAKYKPKEVMDIIKDLNLVENIRIQEDFIDCAIEMPNDIAKEIVPLSKNWIKNPYYSFIPEKVGALILKFLKESEISIALDLLSALLDVGEIKSRQIKPIIDFYQYQKIIQDIVPPIFELNSNKIIEIFCRILSKSITLERFKLEYSDYDGSTSWRPNIAYHKENWYYDDVKNLLINAILDYMIKLHDKDIGNFKKSFILLSRFRFKIFRRLELYLMWLYPKIFQEEINDTFLKKEYVEDFDLEREYQTLLSSQFSNLLDKTKKQILNWVRQGPELKNDMEEGLKRRFKDNWQLNILSAIKKDLPPDWQKIRNDLVKKYIKTKNDHDFHSFKRSFPPINFEILAETTDEELFEILKNFEPNNKIHLLDRIRLGELFRELIEKNPSKYIGMSRKVKQLRPVYISYFLTGYERVLEKNKKFDWFPILQLCRDVLSNSELNDKRDFEERINFKMTLKREIGWFLDSGLKNFKFGPTFKCKKIIWDIIDILIQDPEPTLDDERKYSMDSLKNSYNCVRGIATHLLISYNKWFNHHDTTTSVVLNVKNKIEKMLDFVYEKSSIIRSIFGVYFPDLFEFDRNWAINLIPLIFPKDQKHKKYWNTTWEGFINHYLFKKDLYPILRPEYKKAIEQIENSEISNDSKENLTKHIIIAYLMGLENLNDTSLTCHFFKKSPSKYIEHAMWFIGHLLADNQSKWSKIIDIKKSIGRVSSLWDWRYEELKRGGNERKDVFVNERIWFGFWFINSPFKNEWAINQLHQTLVFTKGKIKFETSVIEELQKYIKNFPNLTLESLILLITSDKMIPITEIYKEKIQSLIGAFGINSSLEIQSLINKIADILVNRGFYEFREFIKISSAE